MSKKPTTYITWCPKRDSQIIEDLRKYKARGRGRRVKDLVHLGLLAESVGLRLLANGPPASLMQPDMPGNPSHDQAPLPSPSPQPPQPAAAAGPASLSPDHKDGLDSLLDSLGIM